MEISEKERIEIDFWKESKTENPGEFTIDNIVNKMGDCAVFLDILSRHTNLFKEAGTILELGGGQGWASCVIKRTFNKRVILSDISEYAVQSVKYWEDIFKVKIDGSFACRSYQVPLENESVDLVYCFAAAHHFVEHHKSVEEIRRILKKGGKALYMYEPTCNKFFYPMAYRRVNNKRPEVPEDLLIPSDMKKIADSLGMKLTVQFDPSLKKRGPVETIYYYMLNKLPFLQRILPCTANYIFEKK